ncbi:hypothetical protein AB4090_12730 [Acidithiobacillus sp. IBUN Pt1247-S3]|uniref:hypothetical protein n=1 Tax=Acidithiobacillus sp. IBUN Pt1247-S3 TaxID=3166642 RepID=UPI0034E3C266
MLTTIPLMLPAVSAASEHFFVVEAVIYSPEKSHSLLHAAAFWAKTSRLSTDGCKLAVTDQKIACCASEIRGCPDLVT